MIERLIKSRIKEIPPYVPGKSKEEIARGYGLKPEDIIKMASNENPLGPPPDSRKAVLKYSEGLHIYPSVDAIELREELAKKTGLSPGNIVVGNGSDEVLDLLMKVFIEQGDQVIITPPTFSMYSSLTKVYGGDVVSVPLAGDDFHFDIAGILDKIGDKTKIVFICSPNNPTGNIIREDELKKILEREVLVVVDEAYGEFSDKSYIQLIEDYENLFITRTFSKAYGLAGLRVGYGVGSKEIIDYILRIKIPFSTNLLAVKAAVAALGDQEHLEKSLRLVEDGREYITDNLKDIDGVKIFPSHANFILMRIKGKPNAQECVDRLFKKGIITRPCKTFAGLGEDYLRVSIGTGEENSRFVEELKGMLG